jgi:hypothetical protein
MKNNKKTIGVLFFIFSITVFYSSAQCAMCKAAAESTLKNGGGGIEKGINSGIIYLMAVPYILLGVFCCVFRKDISRIYHTWRGSSENAAKTMYQKYSFLIKFFTALSIIFISVAYLQLSK